MELETVEPERWAKVVPAFRRPAAGRASAAAKVRAVKAGQVLGRQDDAGRTQRLLNQLRNQHEQLERGPQSRRAPRSRQKAKPRRPNTSNALLSLRKSKSRLINAPKVRPRCNSVLRAPLEWNGAAVRGTARSGGNCRDQPMCCFG